MIRTSDENDSVDRSDVLQNSEQGSVESSMTLSNCLAVLFGVEVLLLVLVLAAVSLFSIDTKLAMLAWGVCCVATIASHLFSWFPKGDEFLLARLAGGMICRTSLPLGFAIWGLKFNEPRIEASIVLILVLVYMSGLAADSWINLRRSKQGAKI